MLVRPPTSPFGGATIGLPPRCFPRSVPVSNTAAVRISGSGSPVNNDIAVYHGRAPSQLRWQSQLLRQVFPQSQAAAAVTPATARGIRLNGLSGENKSSLNTRLIGIIRLASTSAQKKEGKGGGGEQAQQTQGSQDQGLGQDPGQLPPSNLPNEVRQRKEPQLETPKIVQLVTAIRSSMGLILSSSPAAAQKKDRGGEVGVGGEQPQVQSQSQGQLPSTGDATNGVPQLKAPKLEYPERLLIYNAGKGKVMFIAFLKLTTVFIFVAFGLVLAPTYIINGSPLEGTAVLICGLTPMLFLAHTSRPFVAQIHLTKIPPYARFSSDVLLRFVRSLPPQSASRLELTTMSLVGKARGSSLAVSELRPISAAGPGYKKSWLRSVNFVRVENPTPGSSSVTSTSTSATTGGKPGKFSRQLQQVQERQEKLRQKYRQGWRQKILDWTRYKKVNEFYVTDVPQKTAEKRGVKEARVWEEIRGLVEKRAVREAEKRGSR